MLVLVNSSYVIYWTGTAGFMTPEPRNNSCFDLDVFVEGNYPARPVQAEEECNTSDSPNTC